MARFTRKVAVVTGAASGIGRATAVRLASEGARVACVDRDAKGLRETVKLLPAGRGKAYTCDLLSPDAIAKTVKAVVKKFGRIDVLCNIAGGFGMGEAVHETSDATWERLLDLNARTLLHAARAVVPAMLARRSGKIVNVGAASAHKGLARMGAYTASKSVVVRLTEAMAAELRDQGINVNCVLPTIIDTPDNRRAMPDADPARWVAPADLAAVIRFLASDAARAVHGAALPVAGLS